MKRLGEENLGPKHPVAAAGLTLNKAMMRHGLAIRLQRLSSGRALPAAALTFPGDWRKQP